MGGRALVLVLLALGTPVRAQIATDRPDFGTRLGEVLQPLIDDDTLTQAQVDAVIDTLEAARPEGEPGGRGHHRRGIALTVVADTIGITEEEVRDGLRSGQTLAEIAEANGSSADAVIRAILAEMTERAAERVAAGEITQEEADEHLADAAERVTDMVNNGRPGRHAGGVTRHSLVRRGRARRARPRRVDRARAVRRGGLIPRRSPLTPTPPS